MDHNSASTKNAGMGGVNLYSDSDGVRKSGTSEERKMEIARVAYEVYAAYGRSLGEDFHLSWPECGEEHKALVLNTVNRHLANPEMTAEAAHNEWVEEMAVAGWIFAEDKDLDLKTHPLLVDYDKLPAEQTVKDLLFKTIINSMSTMTESDAKAIAKSVAAKGVDRIPVKYIGKRDVYTDGLYKTGLTWEKGQTHMVATLPANQLLKHKDQYVLGDSVDVAGGIPAAATMAEAPKSPDDDQTSEEIAVQEATDMINQMQDVETVKQYAFDNFSGTKLHHMIGLEKAKMQVIQMINQFGLAG